jgi:hypothetical protein
MRTKKRMVTKWFDRTRILDWDEELYSLEIPDIVCDLSNIVCDQEDFEEVKFIKSYTIFKTATFTREELESYVELEDEDSFEACLYVNSFKDEFNKRIDEKNDSESDQDCTYGYRVLRKLSKDSQVELTYKTAKNREITHDNFF